MSAPSKDLNEEIITIEHVEGALQNQALRISISNTAPAVSMDLMLGSSSSGDSQMFTGIQEVGVGSEEISGVNSNNSADKNIPCESREDNVQDELINTSTKSTKDSSCYLCDNLTDPLDNTPSATPSLIQSSRSSINTDGSVPDGVTDCPSVAVIRLHYNVLDDIQALFKKRRKAARANRICWAKKSLGLKNCRDELLLSGRPPTYEALSPLAAAMESEVDRRCTEEVFADT